MGGMGGGAMRGWDSQMVSQIFPTGFVALPRTYPVVRCLCTKRKIINTGKDSNLFIKIWRKSGIWFKSAEKIVLDHLHVQNGGRNFKLKHIDRKRANYTCLFFAPGR